MALTQFRTSAVADERKAAAAARDRLALRASAGGLCRVPSHGTDAVPHFRTSGNADESKAEEGGSWIRG